MIIAVIGAGIAGLTAGNMLAKAGHSVTVFEKSNGFGGRLSTRYAGDGNQIKLDHGAPYVSAGGAEFNEWIQQLVFNGLLAEWTDRLSFHDGSTFYSEHPAHERGTKFIAPNGMNSIGKSISRHVDVVRNRKVGGITLVAPDRLKKRSWVVNFDDSNVFEADAVVIATPGPQAQGIIQTSQDEWGVKFLIRQLSDVFYEPMVTLMAGYGGRQQPDWKGISCQHDILSFICNESSKRPDQAETALVVQSTASFAMDHQNEESALIQAKMIAALPELAGSWSGFPLWTQSHLWRFAHCVAPIQGMSFLELEQSDAHLALVGDYFGGASMETAYLSGKRLAEHWIEKLAK